MDEIYLKYPELIDLDPRKNRIKPYPASSDFMYNRHKIMLNNVNLKNKNILDLGSCLGYSGAYCLDVKKALHYTGVEYSKELADINSSVFKKYFSKDKYQIINDSIENFVKNNNKKFDLTFMLGTLYGLKDPVNIIEHILQFSNTVIFESLYPHRFPGVEEFISDNYPFVSYGEQQMNFDNNQLNLKFTGSRPSLGLIKLLFNKNGYGASLDEFETLKIRYPEYYVDLKRFVVIGSKVNNLQHLVGFVDTYNSPDKDLDQMSI